MNEFLIGGLVALILISIRQVNQYERGVKFTLGRFSGIMDPGWRIVFPIIQSWVRVDMRVKAVDVPDQEAITKDNISARINAVIYYKVRDAERAVIQVENFYVAVSNLAQTTMRNVVGEVSLDELLAERATIAEKIRLIIDEASDPWGIEVQSVALKDISLPEEMKRVIARQAEAERERRAVITVSEGEVQAAGNLAKAANIISQSPGALHLRTLNSINDISSDKSNTVVFAVPLEVLRAFEGLKQVKSKE
ncbi:slipin family protein [Candidatus Berkelbacteria bacterium]|nr:slipin family protein [Candidatus Berkelbacteria bacterium]